MTVVLESKFGFVLNHEIYLQDIYAEVHENNVTLKYIPTKHMFSLCTPYMKDAEAEKKVMLPKESNVNITTASKKRKLERDITENVTSTKIAVIEHNARSLVKEAKIFGFFQFTPSDDDIRSNNKNLRIFSQQFYEMSSTSKRTEFNGANNTNETIVMKFGSEKFLFPKWCRFFCYNVNVMKDYLNVLGKFDLIVIDPPWWNKYIRRVKKKAVAESYEMLNNEKLETLPLKDLLAPGGLIAVWCTNADRHLNAVKHQLLPAWGAKQIANWTWVKVTKAGEPVCSYSQPPGKQPFEQLIFGVSEDQICEPRRVPEDGKLLLSLPSAIHSHKPPLCEVLKSFLPESPQCLDVFARYLLPHWTSWGLEVIKLQHNSLFSSSVVSDTSILK